MAYQLSTPATAYGAVANEITPGGGNPACNNPITLFTNDYDAGHHGNIRSFSPSHTYTTKCKMVAHVPSSLFTLSSTKKKAATNIIS